MTVRAGLRRSLAAMLGAGAMAIASMAPARAPVSAWSTSQDGSRRFAPLATTPMTRPAAHPGDVVITVEPRRRFQSIVGFGAAMTDASAQIIMQRMTPGQRRDLMADLFGRRGLAIAFLRVPIGASDFSTAHYSLDDVPAGTVDPRLEAFSMSGPDRAQVPALRAARALNPALTLIASPWSAPGWMKTGDSLIGGTLKVGAYPAFAAYLSRYLAEMAARGLPVRWLTIQNEPRFEAPDYPGMRLDPSARAAIVGRHLGPLLHARHQRTGILDWDHNWDHPEDPLAVLADPVAARHVAGVAWHCYAGDPSAMARVKAAYPGKDLFFTECSGGAWEADGWKAIGWMADSLLIDAGRAGARGMLLWNLALDETHGPHLGGCGNCRGVVTVDSRSGAVTREPEYYLLAHSSKLIRPGARRIASTQAEAVGTLAARNPDGGTVLIVRNRGVRPVSLLVREQGRAFRATLPAGELASFAWHGGSR